MALVRLIGWVSSDGIVAMDLSSGTAFVGHQLDVVSVVREIMLVLDPNKAPHIRPPSAANNTYKVSLPARLCQILASLRVRVGDRIKQALTFPAVVLDTNTPT